jgi:hypothetical protein
MQWVTNAAKQVTTSTVYCMYGETHQQALERERKFRKRLIQGSPKATTTYTIEQLEDMGMIGLYAFESQIGE